MTAYGILDPYLGGLESRPAQWDPNRDDPYPQDSRCIGDGSASCECPVCDEAYMRWLEEREAEGAGL